MIPTILRLRWIKMETYKRYLECTVPNVGSIWSMSDEEVRKLPEFRRTIYEEYQKFAFFAQAAVIILPSIYTAPWARINNVWWPANIQVGISLSISIWIFWLQYKIRKTNREIMVREIMES